MSKLLLIFIPVYLGGLIGTIAYDVSWGIFLYQLQYFVNPESSWFYSQIPDLRFTFIISVIILVAFIIKHDRYKHTLLLKFPQSKWLLIMLSMLVIISLYAAWPEKHFDNLINFIKLLIFMAIAIKVINTDLKLEISLWVFLIGEFYLSWGAYGLGRNAGDRLEGFGTTDASEANDLGLLIMTSIPILIFYLLKGNKLQKIISVGFLLFVLNALVLLNSRGAFVGMVVSSAYLLFIMMLNKAKETNLRIKVLSLVIICICMFMYVTDSVFWVRLSTLSDSSIEETQAESGRVYFWLRTFQLVREHPFGVGEWGYQKLSPQFIPDELLTGGMRAVHSTYFQALATFGYLGIPLLAGIILSTFNLFRKLKKYLFINKQFTHYYKTIALEASFIGFLVSAAFIDRLFAEIFYWLLMYSACFANVYAPQYKWKDSNSLEQSA